MPKLTDAHIKAAFSIYSQGFLEKVKSIVGG